MSFATKSLAVAFVGVMLSATGAFAQAGGTDVPSDAKSQGAKENGASSVGAGSMKKDDGSMEKGGAMKKGDSMEKKGGDKM